jgi:hypothetical protein
MKPLINRYVVLAASRPPTAYSSLIHCTHQTYNATAYTLGVNASSDWENTPPIVTTHLMAASFEGEESSGKRRRRGGAGGVSGRGAVEQVLSQ